MIKNILISATVGVFLGYFLVTDDMKIQVLKTIDILIIVWLSALLFSVGMDLSADDQLMSKIKKVGWRVLLMPIASIVGTLVAVGIGTIFLPLALREGLAVGSGFGWYTLAPVMLADYSARISAISFMHNVLREMLGIVLIPIVAKYIGYVECCALPGAAAMDVCLPVVEKATNPNIAVYSFIMGVVTSFAVPVLVPIFAGL